MTGEKNGGRPYIDRARARAQSAPMFTFGLGGQAAGGLDAAVLLSAALALEALLGEARWLFKIIPHPIAVMGAAAGWLDRRLNRERRAESVRAVRGLFAALVIICAAGALGAALAEAARSIRFGWTAELAALTLMLAGRSLYTHVRRVSRALQTGGLEAGREAVSHIAGRAPKHLDRHGVCRTAVESLAENFSDAVVAPAFWYLVFGLPGVFAYKAVNTLDSMIGHMTPRHRAFGMAAARMDDIANWIPARLSGLFIALAALFAPRASPGRALKVMFRDAGKHRSPNAGWPEGAMAGAVDCALAGPRRYAHGAVNDPWIGGEGTAMTETAHIKRALGVYAAANLILALTVVSLALLKLSN
ncbi:MAG: adenosylcobinamide-phosphate synthase CbiB [Rhodospirillales bacterium]